MKSYILIFTLFIFQISFAQKTIEIEYQSIIRSDSININWQATYQLQINTHYSIYFKNTTLKNNKENSGNSIIFKPKNSSKNNDFLFKDYEKNEMISKDLISFRFKVIKDSINNFNWQIKKDTITILGYKCNLAETNFRGRNYKVWFASDLQAGGPWKLDGLPGMILKADTKDGYYSVEASSLKINTTENINDYGNPFADEKEFYSWVEFKNLYKEKAINVSKYNNTNTLITTPKIRLERYIEEDDPDYNVKKIITNLRKN